MRRSLFNHSRINRRVYSLTFRVLGNTADAEDKRRQRGFKMKQELTLSVTVTLLGGEAEKPDKQASAASTGPASAKL